ncbi:MAG: hypothetical protein M3405_16440 [Acidobacteriota bacterium]|jgi:hypothetical protein|nr:hypothetical protein [Acidobacteriota bacterium]
MTLLDELNQLISALEENKIEYAVCGGSREGLIKMKKLAGRPQDLADIARLEDEES